MRVDPATAATRLKLAAAALLLISSTLPLYTCTRYHGPDGSVANHIPRGADSSAYHPFVERHYALTEFPVRDGGFWVTLLGFFWPAPVALGSARLNRPRVRGVVTVLELVLILGSLWWVAVVSDLGTRASGAYVAMGAFVVYFLGWAVEVRRALRRVPAPC
jgi:hypothetical protein